MKKKLIIVLSIVGGVLCVGGAVSYFFFWDDLRLLFGQATVKQKSAGNDDLLSDFSDEAPAEKGPTAAGAAKPVNIANTGGGETKPVETVRKEEAGGEDIGGDEEDMEEESPAAPQKSSPAAPATAAKKSEAVPALTRGGGTTVAPTPEPPKPSKPVAGAARPSKKEEPEELGDEEEQARPAPRSVHAAKPVVSKPAAKQAEPSADLSVHQKAQSLIQRKKYAEAETLLKQHLGTHPSDGDAHFMMGFLMMQQGRKGQAVAFFQRAAQTTKDPEIRLMAEQYLKKLK